MFPLKNVAAQVIAFEEDEFLERTLTWLSSRVSKVYLGGCRCTFMGTDKRKVSPVKVVAARLKSHGISNIVYVDCDFTGNTNPAINEAMARNQILESIRKDNIPWTWIVDSDETYTDTDAKSLWNFFFDNCSRHSMVAGMRSKMRTYWRSLHWRIEPMEEYAPLIVIRSDVNFTMARNTQDESHIVFAPPEIGRMIHYSWVKSPADTWKKISSWGHAHQLIPGWYENVFMKWTPGCNIENLHPTVPSAYKKVVRCDLPIPESMVGHQYLGKDVIEDKPPQTSGKLKIKAVILNHNKPENADKLFEQLSTAFDDVEIFDSGSDYDKIPIHMTRSFSNIYWSGGWNEIIKTCGDYDAVWMLGCDIELKDKPEKYRKAIEKSLPFGVWSPCVEGRAHDYMQACHFSHGKPKSVRCMEGISIALSGELIGKIGGKLVEASTMGFGQDLWLCYMGREAGLKNVIDGRVKIFHPSHIGYSVEKAAMEMEIGFGGLFGDFRRVFDWRDNYQDNLIDEEIEDSKQPIPSVVDKPVYIPPSVSMELPPKQLTIITVDNGWGYPEFMRITSAFPDLKKIIVFKGASGLPQDDSVEIVRYKGSIDDVIEKADIALFPKVGAANKAEFLRILQSGIPTIVHVDHDQKAIEHMVDGYVYRDESWAVNWLKQLMSLDERLAVHNKLIARYQGNGLVKQEESITVPDVKRPLVSVITPTYRRDAKIIKRSIDCLKLQTVTNWEQLICSDGSEEHHVRELVGGVGDVRISYHFTQGKKDGDYGNSVRSEMLKKAKGRYVLFCDDDNLIMPNYFEKMVKAVEDAGVDFAVCRVIHFGPLNESEIGKPPIVLAGNPIKLYYIDPLQVLVKREVMLDIGWDNEVGYLSDGVTLERLGNKYKHVRVEDVLGIHI